MSFTKTVILRGGPWHGQAREVRESATCFNLAESPAAPFTVGDEPVHPSFCTFKVWRYRTTGSFTRGGAEIFDCA